MSEQMKRDTKIMIEDIKTSIIGILCLIGGFCCCYAIGTAVLTWLGPQTILAPLAVLAGCILVIFVWILLFLCAYHHIVDYPEPL